MFGFLIDKFLSKNNQFLSAFEMRKGVIHLSVTFP